jgi:polysaccharide export outer membrane protein
MVLIAGCTTDPPAIGQEDTKVGEGPNYRIGPGDVIEIFVWRNPELTISLPVRPDGKISTPLVEDMQAANKTPSQLARDIETALATYVKSPVVTVMVTGFAGPFADQVRVVGEATSPQALPYRENMSILDVMIAVGGLTEYADGNRARIIRVVDGQERQFRVRLHDLVKRGDISANVQMLPGDILIIPETVF